MCRYAITYIMKHTEQCSISIYASIFILYLIIKPGKLDALQVENMNKYTISRKLCRHQLLCFKQQCIVLIALLMDC